MPTEKMSFKGKVAWCRPDQANEWGKYSTRFYPIAEDLERMKKLPIKNEWKTDDAEGEFTNVSCPAEREYRGRKIINKIVVTNKDGGPHYTDVHGFIGDGSDVTLLADYYDHPIKGSLRRGHALKWTGLTIENLVPYKTLDQPGGNELPQWS